MSIICNRDFDLSASYLGSVAIQMDINLKWMKKWRTMSDNTQWTENQYEMPTKL